MKNVCIITDSSVQFPKPNFPGRELVTVLTYDVYFDGQILSENDCIRPTQLPKVATNKLQPHLIAPEPEKIRRTLVQLSQQFDTIFAVFQSKEISNIYQNAVQAGEGLKSKNSIHYIDSKTTSAGLGLLILQLIEGILCQETLDQIDRRIRSTVSRLYTLICTPSLSYLHYNGFIEKTQSVVSEMLGIVPVFAIEDGVLSPIEKVKSPRHSLSYYQEFIDEFERVDHIAFIQSAKPNFKDARDFHDGVRSSFPDCSFSKHPINLPLSFLFGPFSTCIVVQESN